MANSAEDIQSVLPPVSLVLPSPDFQMVSNCKLKSIHKIHFFKVLCSKRSLSERCSSTWHQSLCHFWTSTWSSENWQLQTEMFSQKMTKKKTSGTKCPEPSATWWRGLAGGYCHSGWLVAPRLATVVWQKRRTAGATMTLCHTHHRGPHPIHRTHARSWTLRRRKHVSTLLVDHNADTFVPGEDLHLTCHEFLQGIPSFQYQCPWDLAAWRWNVFSKGE